MQSLLGAEFKAFEAELETNERVYAIRANSQKMTRDKLAHYFGLTEAVPWSDTGLYATREARLGAHPLHHAGAYYVQEPSAQAVALALGVQANALALGVQANALALGVQANLRVLDLCAAPGGKSTHLAALMHNQGVLVCNEISATRGRALAENLERLGCIGMVTNEEPARLAQQWGAFFDRVLVDAPCSGEGMFRKHTAAIESWSEAQVKTCAVRQKAILENAAALLCTGGILVYSTCTFAVEENEAVIEDFLSTHPEFSLEPILGFKAGINGIGSRLYPHLIRGEGHFLARLCKDGITPTPTVQAEFKMVGKDKHFKEFTQEFHLPDGIALEFRQEIQIVQPNSPSLAGIRVSRAGIPVAHLEKNRLEPHHGLSRVIKNYVNTVELSDLEIIAYLRGETITQAGKAGWVLLETQGLALGWGKRVGGIIKNHYPKHLRGKVVLLED
jgi:16S rRNA C967 or C1407 C5-methylase (RsmB/RsmF family)/NOL1/NOP2/fmu family ribosome biogenesis protein